VKKILILILIVIFVSACSALAGDEDSLPDIVQLVLDTQILASSETNPDIEIIDYERVVWGDSCLELGGPAESCLAEPVSGWLVTLRDGETEYQVHADDEGHMRRK
jgi:hypothetical protein